MLAIPNNTRIFVHREPTDMRKGFPGLVALAESVLKQDPLVGHLFVFLNKRRDRIKILYWGGTGFCLWCQLLESGTYQLPQVDPISEKFEMTRSQLSLMLDGIDFASVKQRKRFQLENSTETDATDTSSIAT